MTIFGDQGRVVLCYYHIHSKYPKEMVGQTSPKWRIPILPS